MPQAPVPDPVADCTLRDRALLVDGVLVVADLHLGQGAASQLDFPVGDTTRTVDALEALLERTDPEHLVLAGDTLHSFSTVPTTVADALETIVAAATDRGVEAIALQGNHDAMLEAVWQGEVRDSYRVGDTVICHGHEAPTERGERYVIGHEHPVLSVAGRRRPCYLVGESGFEGGDLVVLPAFGRLLRGVVVNEMRADEFMSPLVTDADGLAPVVWDEDARETLDFPPLGEFRERL